LSFRKGALVAAIAFLFPAISRACQAETQRLRAAPQTPGDVRFWHT